ncbi:hypothetical protein [Novosphingobium sp.]|uniref:hypothetical protein n=1 Tax=Novosphingobium sp. TaxID=1874826 RepID=UPI0035ADB628
MTLFANRRPVLPALLLLMLGACGGGDADSNKQANRDPAITGALSDPIMADPDLASQNRGNSALSGGGPANGELPPLKRTPEEVEAAKTAAEELAGGSIGAAPAASATSDHSPLDGAITAEARAAALGLAGQGCAAKLGYSFGWAAKLHPAFPIYPRGHTAEAAGSDAAGCKVRSVSYVTPVDPAAVVDFHYAMLAKAGLRADHRKAGSDEILSGQGFAIAVRAQPGGLTEVIIVTNGL